MFLHESSISIESNFLVSLLLSSLCIDFILLKTDFDIRLTVLEKTCCGESLAKVNVEQFSAAKAVEEYFDNISFTLESSAVFPFL